MPKPDVTFVNTMTVSGFLNGVCNLSFTTARFTAEPVPPPPESDDGVWGVRISPDEYPSLYLRMDLACAQQVYAALGKIIEENTKPAPGGVN